VCVDVGCFTAEASLARLETHGLVPTRGEAVQVHFAGLSDDELLSCGGDEVKLKVLTDQRLLRSRQDGGEMMMMMMMVMM
jgi:hypothetical protein